MSRMKNVSALLCLVLGLCGSQQIKAQVRHDIIQYDIIGEITSTECIDFDGDLDLDVLVSSETGASRLDWLEQIDPLNWVQHTIETDDSVGYMKHFATTDVDGDSDLDIMVVREVNQLHEFAWYENDNGDWLAHPIAPNSPNPLSRPSRVPVADYEGDGDLDYLFRSGTFSRTNVYWMLNDGGGTTWTPVFAQADSVSGTLFGDERVDSFLPGDMDNDGLMDLVFGTYGNQDYYVQRGVYIKYHNGGNAVPVYQVNSYYYDAKYISGILDFNNDGFMDIIYEDYRWDIPQRFASNILHRVSLNEYDRVQLSGNGTNYPFWRVLDAIDYDSDGHLDFMVDNLSWPDSFRGIVYYDQDLQSFYQNISPIYHETLYSGDINGDGAIDHILQTSDLAWYENEQTFDYGRIRLIPVTDTVSPGDTFVYGASIFHAAQNVISAHVIGDAFGPQGGRLRLINTPVVLIPSESRDFNGLTLDVPAWAQPGEYLFRVAIRYAGQWISSDEVTFTVTGEPLQARPENWREQQSNIPAQWQD
ncbi:VCBS repeat-containing protein [bacterium]|nr:VCBS repeat-containing protein [bacterium]